MTQSQSFAVDLGDGRGFQPFASVTLPEFYAAGAGSDTLVVRRPVTRDPGLYRWWDAFRRNAHSAPRQVSIELRDAEGAAIVQWIFHETYPVAIAYSPLVAGETAPALEIISLAFDRFELI